MKLNCLSCGHTVNLDDAYGEYNGDIKCFVCGSTLHVVIEHEHVKSVKLAAAVGEPGQPR
jgi:DNA-directed RNA polymerase subunit N (RpoN/RPB10)